MTLRNEKPLALRGSAYIRRATSPNPVIWFYVACVSQRPKGIRVKWAFAHVGFNAEEPVSHAYPFTFSAIDANCSQAV